MSIAPLSRRLALGAAAIALAVSACGSDSSEADQAAAPVTAAAPAAAPTPGSVDVLAAETELGSILVGPDGRTLYGFTNDIDAISACYGTCAEAWPPVIVSENWTAGPGLDFGIFATTQRDDGQLQLVAGQWPLYYFAGDAVPGDTNGQGSGEVWFAVDVDGRLITDAAAAAPATDGEAAGEPDGEADGGTGDAAITVGATELGDVLVDEGGLTLYGFTDDSDGSPTCTDACADAWPPVIVDGPDLPAGLDPALYSVAERPDGAFQLQAGIWPLYRFAGDAGPGDINGQASGNVWFAVAPDGSLIDADGATAGTTDDESSADPVEEDDGY